jgi:hypothetical protein
MFCRMPPGQQNRDTAERDPGAFDQRPPTCVSEQMASRKLTPLGIATAIKLTGRTRPQHAALPRVANESSCENGPACVASIIEYTA